MRITGNEGWGVRWRGSKRTTRTSSGLLSLVASALQGSQPPHISHQGPTGDNVNHIRTSDSRKRKANTQLMYRTTLTDRAAFHHSKRQKTSDFRTSVKKWAESVHDWLGRSSFFSLRVYCRCLSRIYVPLICYTPSRVLVLLYSNTRSEYPGSLSSSWASSLSSSFYPAFDRQRKKKKTCSTEIIQINGTAQMCSHLAFLGATRSWYFFSHAAQGTPDFRLCSLWSCYHHLTLTIIHIQYSCARLLLPSWTD